MPLNIRGLIHIRLETPWGYYLPVMRDAQTQIELEDYLVEGPHWARVAHCLAEAANVTPGQYLDAFGEAERYIYDLVVAVGASSENDLEAYQMLMYGGDPSDEANEVDVSVADHTLFWRRRRAAREAATIKKRIKGELIAHRRKEFDAIRADVLLAMLNRGDDYLCSTPDCLASEGLTIDHIIPVSRGGTDDLANLQFLCRSCNASKGDRARDTHPKDGDAKQGSAREWPGPAKQDAPNG